MSVLARTMSGIAWTATGGTLQLFVSLATFTLVASQLQPAEIGAFGVALMMVGFAEILTANPFSESLQQRREIIPDHLSGTFWCVLAASICAMLILFATSTQIGALFSTPLSAPIVIWLAIALPFNALSTVNDALLARDLKFDLLARAGAVSGLVAGAVAIIAITMGLGVWSLVLSDLAGRAYCLIRIWSHTRFIPGPPSSVKAVRDLTKFNITSLAIHVLGFLDAASPRFLTGLILGPAALGYLIVAQRAMGMVAQLVLGPISNVTMAAVARLQDKREELQRLILSLYKLAAVLGYPAFLGFIVVIPDLAGLFGDKWLAAVVVAQVLAIRGLRLTTGALNVAILRGVGDTWAPLILLGTGFVLQLFLIPAFSTIGLIGIAIAMLVRTLVTWPVGLHYVKRASGLTMKQQLMAGAEYFLAAFAMMLCVIWTLSNLAPDTHVSRLVTATLVGLSSYAILLCLLNWKTVSNSVKLLLNGKWGAATQTFWLGIREKNSS